MTLFTQWERLASVLAGIARTAASENTRYALNRIDLSTGSAVLKDRATNRVTLAGGSATLSMPETESGLAHDFLVRAACTAETELSFAGGTFESDDETALDSPSAGETCVYMFTETAPGVYLVGRKIVNPIGGE